MSERKSGISSVVQNKQRKEEPFDIYVVVNL